MPNRLGEGENAVTVIRTPARYGALDALAKTLPPAAGEHNGELLG